LRRLNPLDLFSLQKVIFTAWTRRSPCPIDRRFKPSPAPKYTARVGTDTPGPSRKLKDQNAMDSTETSEGLSRMYNVTVPAAALQQRLNDKIEEIRPSMNLKGFRPGKVPANHVRKMYGKSIMGDVVQEVIQEETAKQIEEADIRPAGQPEMTFKSDMTAVVDGKEDLAFEMQVDIMPEFEPTDVTKLTVVKPVCEISDEEITERLTTIAENNQKYEKRGKTAKARDKDAVVIDFIGKLDGEAFEGGAAEQHTLVLGSNSFIPGFEDQLIGKKAGDETIVRS